MQRNLGVPDGIVNVRLIFNQWRARINLIRVFLYPIGAIKQAEGMPTIWF